MCPTKSDVSNLEASFYLDSTDIPILLFFPNEAQYEVFGNQEKHFLSTPELFLFLLLEWNLKAAGTSGGDI